MKTLLKFLFVLVLLNVISFIAFGQTVEETEDYTTISVIVNIILSALSAFLGGFMQKFKSKLGKVASLLDKVKMALEDNSLTQEEIKGIVESAREVVK